MSRAANEERVESGETRCNIEDVAAAWERGERGQGSQFDRLSEGVTAWGTPRTSDAKDSGPVGSKSFDHMLDRDYLCAEVRSFATPGPTPPPTGEPMARSDSSPPEPWPTTRAQDAKHHAPSDAEMTTDHAGTVDSPRVRTAQFDGKKKSRGLNPRFALWLMGFPTTWLDATPPKKQRKAK